MGMWVYVEQKKIRIVKSFQFQKFNLLSNFFTGSFALDMGKGYLVPELTADELWKNK